MDIIDQNNYLENIILYANSARKSDNSKLRYALMENIKASAEEYLKYNDGGLVTE